MNVVFELLNVANDLLDDVITLEEARRLWKLHIKNNPDCGMSNEYDYAVFIGKKIEYSNDVRENE